MCPLQLEETELGAPRGVHMYVVRGAVAKAAEQAIETPLIAPRYLTHSETRFFALQRSL